MPTGRFLLVTTSNDPVPFRGESLFESLEIVSFEMQPEALLEAEVAVAGKWTPEMNAAAPNLKWLHFWTAGLDSTVIPDLVRRGVIITHSSGVHAPKIAAHMMASILMFACRMPYFMRAQSERLWKQEDQGYDDLTGSTIGIAGLGRIGEALAVRARSFGMRVIAAKRDTQHRYDPKVVIDKLYRSSQLADMVAESDHVCITMRYTPDTHHLFDTQMLSHMKPAAYLYNTGRGRIVDEQALIAALREGRIKGAGLDVFETEPLPADSPLWTMENVIITPHVAGYNPNYFRRASQIFAENLQRYRAGEPLHNRYDPARGY
jgi:phosphoglycerate dehydrogenase-like enzyme